MKNLPDFWSCELVPSVNKLGAIIPHAASGTHKAFIFSLETWLSGKYSGKRIATSQSCRGR
jgi:hypothetical protein